MPGAVQPLPRRTGGRGRAGGRGAGDTGRDPGGGTRPVRRQQRAGSVKDWMEVFLPVRLPRTAHSPDWRGRQRQRRRDSDVSGGLGQVEGVPFNSTVLGLL